MIVILYIGIIMLMCVLQSIFNKKNAKILPQNAGRSGSNRKNSQVGIGHKDHGRRHD